MIFVGALVIGVPLAATLGIVAWFTNYIPYFGAIISGAFAVLVAWGAGGPSMAVPMLIIVILANGFLQTVVSQFALGSALDLHPLVVLLATTAGGILFGAVGGVFAAPFVKIALDTYERVKDGGPLRRRAARAPTAAPRTGEQAPGRRGTGRRRRPAGAGRGRAARHELRSPGEPLASVAGTAAAVASQARTTQAAAPHAHGGTRWR